MILKIKSVMNISFLILCANLPVRSSFVLLFPVMLAHIANAQRSATDLSTFASAFLGLVFLESVVYSPEMVSIIK